MAFRHPQTRQLPKSDRNKEAPATEVVELAAKIADKIQQGVENFLNDTEMANTSTTHEEQPAPVVEEVTPVVEETPAQQEPEVVAPVAAAPEPKRRGPKPGFKKAVKTTA